MQKLRTSDRARSSVALLASCISVLMVGCAAQSDKITGVVIEAFDPRPARVSLTTVRAECDGGEVGAELYVGPRLIEFRMLSFRGVRVPAADLRAVNDELGSRLKGFEGLTVFCSGARWELQLVARLSEEQGESVQGGRLAFDGLSYTGSAWVEDRLSDDNLLKLDP